METTAPKKAPKWLTNPLTWLILFVLLNLIVGVFIVSDFGESTDEIFEETSALAALEAYAHASELDLEEHYRSVRFNFRYYGTAQTMLFQAAEQTLTPILDSRPGVVRHYAYFVTFQVAIVAIYFLVGAFTSSWVALAVSILFGTQPLLFGHAFINPKDIPFLAIFTATVAAGFHLSGKFEKKIFSHPLHTPRIEWKQIGGEIKRFAASPAIIWLGVITLLLTLIRIFASQIAIRLVSALFNAPENSLLGKVFQLLASNASAGSLEAYVNKGVVLFEKWFNIAVILAVLGLLAFALIQFMKKDLIGKQAHVTLLEPEDARSTRLPFLLYLAAAGAGAIWGIAIATRIIGLAAGGIVGLGLLLEFRKKSILPLIVYTVSAGAACYAAWPYLWALGIPGFIESLKVFADFSTWWDGIILFEGEILTAGMLPPYYMLKLIALQLTIPVLVLSVFGISLGLLSLRKKPEARVKIFMLLAWFFLPILYTVICNTVQYDNFRQYIFILPPLFVFAGITLEWIIQKFQRQWVLPAATLIALVPAVIALVQLHPFQYIYYNEFTGGVEGAFREYELDYWLTSYMHAADWIDENIPPGSSILVWGSSRRIVPYIENEYEYFNPYHLEIEEYDQTDYVLVTTEYHLDIEHHSEDVPIFAVERDNAQLVIIMENLPSGE